MAHSRPETLTDAEEGRVEERQLQVARLADLGLMASVLLHELRQPLFAIKGNAQLLGVDIEDDGRLSRILDQVEQMEDLIRDYGGMNPAPERVAAFDLNEPVRHAMDMLGKRRKGALLEVELASEPVPVRGRPSAMRQVALNLLQNAFEAVDGRSGRRVTIRTLRQGRWARLEVADNGPGISSTVLPHLFEPFVTGRGDEGTGLGLYVVRRLVEQACGRVEVSDSEMDGARFVVELPLDEPA